MHGKDLAFVVQNRSKPLVKQLVLWDSGPKPRSNQLHDSTEAPPLLGTQVGLMQGVTQGLSQGPHGVTGWKRPGSQDGCHQGRGQNTEMKEPLFDTIARL